FDLKSGFWQLGIKPEDRPKTAFCIPDYHYQWKVMPFGLKNAPSAFQKAMITIFEPILANTLVYIDELSSQKMIQQFLGSESDQVPSRKDASTKDSCLRRKKNPTDASDECWGAVLLVQDNNNKRHVCGYKSGTFKAFEQHYHSTFKEILAVKRGIEKFQLHLIRHEFQVEMDMSSFPRMLQFKRKMLPHAQLLRWSNWFSQWKFTVKHIKGTENVLADSL
ncbi:putative reverse transcriptase domain, viral movement protein, partial [Tanacetum coccineum]